MQILILLHFYSCPEFECRCTLAAWKLLCILGMCIMYCLVSSPRSHAFLADLYVQKIIFESLYTAIYTNILITTHSHSTGLSLCSFEAIWYSTWVIIKVPCRATFFLDIGLLRSSSFPISAIHDSFKLHTLSEIMSATVPAPKSVRN